MRKNWNEQQAIITGAASGIGLAIARKLHGLGVRIALCDVDPKKLQAMQPSFHERVTAHCFDVTDLATVEASIKNVLDRNGPVDILVNSAGITGITNVKSQEVDPVNVNLVFRVNFFGSYYMSRAVLPGMLRQG